MKVPGSTRPAQPGGGEGLEKRRGIVARRGLRFRVTSGTKPKRRPAPQALHRGKQKIRELTRRTRSISLEQRNEGERDRSACGTLCRYCKIWISGSAAGCEPCSGSKGKRGQERFRHPRQRNRGTTLAAQTAGSPHSPGASGEQVRPCGRPSDCLLRFARCSLMVGSAFA